MNRSTSTQKNKSLETFFFFPIDGYHFIYDKIFDLYTSDPTAFADTFFDLLPEINPKIVRILLYELYTHGISADKLYAQRSLLSLPNFLFTLDTFPSETLLVIMKYGFPAFPDENIFFYWSLKKYGKWLDFALDISNHLNINLNSLNDESGFTILHEAVSYGYLPLINQILRYRVDPNVTSTKGITPLMLAASLLSYPDASVNYPVYLEIIKQLIRYGAMPEKTFNDLVQISPYREKIHSAILAGKDLFPEYAVSNELLMSRDLIEDLVLAAQMNPNLLYDAKFQSSIPGTNMTILKESLERERKEVAIASGQILSWPYFINSSSPPGQYCPISVDDRITAESPPDPSKAYEMALRKLKDVTPSKDTEARPDAVPDVNPAAFESDEPWESFAAAPTPYLEGPPTVPIPAAALLPTNRVELPSNPI